MSTDAMGVLNPPVNAEVIYKIELRAKNYFNCGFAHDDGYYSVRKVTDTYKTGSTVTGTIITTTTVDAPFSATGCTYSTTTEGSTGGGSLATSVTTYESAYDITSDYVDPINALVDALDPDNDQFALSLSGDFGFANLVPVTSPSFALTGAQFLLSSVNVQVIRIKYKFIVTKDHFPPHVYWNDVIRDGAFTIVTTTPRELQMGAGLWETDWTELYADLNTFKNVENAKFLLPWFE